MLYDLNKLIDFTKISAGWIKTFLSYKDSNFQLIIHTFF